MANMARARGQALWAKEQKRWRTKRRSRLSGTRHSARVAGTGLSARGHRNRLIEVLQNRGAVFVAVRLADAASAGHPNG